MKYRESIGMGVVSFLFSMVNICIRAFFLMNIGTFDPTSELLQEKSHGDNHEDRDEDDKND